MAPSEPQMEGREIKIYDPRRRPPEWTDLVSPTGCAVFLKNAATGTSLSPRGAGFASERDCTCLLFDTVEQAGAFGRAMVRQYPFMCCEIFDAEGRANPPLLVVLHPSAAPREEDSPAWLRRRKWIALALFSAAVPLFWLDWKSHGEWILPTVVGINLIVAGLRFLYWNAGLKHRGRLQQERLKHHLDLEKSGQASGNAIDSTY